MVDRTMVCAAALSGGIHEVEIRVQGGAVRKGSRWEKPALVMTTTGSIGSAALALDNAIAWVVAGTPTAHANLVETVVGVPYPVNTWGTVAMSNRCKVSRERPGTELAGPSRRFGRPARRGVRLLDAASRSRTDSRRAHGAGWTQQPARLPRHHDAGDRGEDHDRHSRGKAARLCRSAGVGEGAALHRSGLHPGLTAQPRSAQRVETRSVALPRRSSATAISSRLFSIQTWTRVRPEGRRIEITIRPRCSQR